MNFSFLYKSYEKITLTIVLIIFLIANMAKYDQMSQSYYNFDTTLSNNQLWQPSEKRDLDKNDEFYIAIFTDFMKPCKIIRSPLPLRQKANLYLMNTV